MKKFKYRLEALLKLKDHIEKERQKEHALARANVDRQLTELEQIDQDRLTTVGKQRGRMTGGITVAEMLVYSRYLHKIKRDRAVGREMLRALEKEAEGKRLNLVEASKERKPYENLKERQIERYQQAAKALETKDNDETAITSYRRSGTRKKK